MARLDDKLELEADLTSESTESSTDRVLRPNRRTILGGAAALIVAGLGASSGVLAHGGDDDDKDDHDNSGPGGGGHDDDDDHHGLPPEQSTQVTDVTTVRIVDERFEPNNILIETGQTVTWENRDDDQHSASGRGMDTGVINPGGKGTVTFLDPGEFQYTCNFHPEMLAWLRSPASQRRHRRRLRKPVPLQRRWRWTSRSSISRSIQTRRR